MSSIRQPEKARIEKFDTYVGDGVGRCVGDLLGAVVGAAFCGTKRNARSTTKTLMMRSIESRFIFRSERIEPWSVYPSHPYLSLNNRLPVD